MNAATLICFIAIATCTVVNGKTIIVAKSGGNFTTITDGLKAATPGDTVEVKSGVYSEIIKWPVSGTENHFITLMSGFDSTPAIIDGSSIAVSATSSELILISNKNYIRIDNLEIRNSVTSSDQFFNKGIQIEGTSSHIEIVNCRIHNIENNSTSENGGSNAIGVFGRSGSTPITGIVIDRCEIYSNKTGYSESVSLDGNVDGFRITNNYIHDNNNIGILIAGSYGECEGCGSADQVRHGVISDNYVTLCSSCENPAYKGDCSAGGIYSDGGAKTIIERNTITYCDIGVDAGAELTTGNSDSLIIRDNLIVGCNIGGIYVGGYETSRGWTTNTQIVNNTLYKNDAENTGSGELLLMKAHDITAKNNILYTTSQKVAINIEFASTYCYNTTFDNNLFYSVSGASGIKGTELDKKAIIADPQFVNAGTDFHCKVQSPAVNGCDVSYVPAVGELDLDKQPRKMLSAVDIGAYEHDGAGVQSFYRRYSLIPVKSPVLRLSVNSRYIDGVTIEQNNHKVFNLRGMLLNKRK